MYRLGSVLGKFFLSFIEDYFDRGFLLPGNVISSLAHIMLSQLADIDVNTLIDI